MSFIVHEKPKHPNKPYKLLLSALKDAFVQCHSFHRSLPAPSVQENESAASDINEQEVVILTIRTRAMEAKLKRKRNLKTENFQWVLSPMKEDSFVYPKGMQEKAENEDQDDDDDNNDNDNEDEETEAFFSVGSCFTRCSSTASREVFFSTRNGFSHCSSAKGIEFGDVWRRRSIIQELQNCEGWPFGLCRKAMMLPPLPTSPSESWSWSKLSKAPQMVKFRSF